MQKYSDPPCKYHRFASLFWVNMSVSLAGCSVILILYVFIPELWWVHRTGLGFSPLPGKKNLSWNVTDRGGPVFFLFFVSQEQRRNRWTHLRVECHTNLRELATPADVLYWHVSILFGFGILFIMYVIKLVYVRLSRYHLLKTTDACVTCRETPAYIQPKKYSTSLKTRKALSFISITPGRKASNDLNEVTN